MVYGDQKLGTDFSIMNKFMKDIHNKKFNKLPGIHLEILILIAKMQN